jgi:hypothetical protein
MSEATKAEPKAKAAPKAAAPAASAPITEKEFLARAKVEEFKPSDLTLHKDLQGRARGTDAEHAGDIGKALRSGEYDPSKVDVKAVRITEGANVRVLPWDGHHTVTGALEEKVKTIRVRVMDGTWAEAVTLAAQANASHLAKKRTHADKERQLRMFFAAHPKASANAAGKHVGVDDKTAGRVKAEMGLKGGKVVGKDGREQVATKPATPAWRKAVFDEQIAMPESVEKKVRELGVNTVGDLSDAIEADAKSQKPVLTPKERADLGEQIDQYQNSLKRSAAAPKNGNGHALWVPSETQGPFGMFHRSLGNLAKSRPGVEKLPEFVEARALTDKIAVLIEKMIDKAKSVAEAKPEPVQPPAAAPAKADPKATPAPAAKDKKPAAPTAGEKADPLAAAS